jgi:hypothetical protein
LVENFTPFAAWELKAIPLLRIAINVEAVERQLIAARRINRVQEFRVLGIGYLILANRVVVRNRAISAERSWVVRIARVADVNESIVTAWATTLSPA